MSPLLHELGHPRRHPCIAWSRRWCRSLRPFFPGACQWRGRPGNAFRHSFPKSSRRCEYFAAELLKPSRAAQSDGGWGISLRVWGSAGVGVVYPQMIMRIRQGNVWKRVAGISSTTKLSCSVKMQRYLVTTTSHPKASPPAKLFSENSRYLLRNQYRGRRTVTISAEK